MKRARDDGAAAAAAKTKKKRRKKKKKAADSWTQPTARHAFDVSTPSDHAETPVNAYEDLAPFMRAVGGRVYDPYYCDGGVVRRLTALGFRDVVNENRDFYADVSNGTVPRHDLLMTNPPYSGDHVDRLIFHVVAAKRPFALLIPTYYLGRDVWRRAASALSPPPFSCARTGATACRPRGPETRRPRGRRRPSRRRGSAGGRRTGRLRDGRFEFGSGCRPGVATSASQVTRRHRPLKAAEPRRPASARRRRGGAFSKGEGALVDITVASAFREPATAQRRRRRPWHKNRSGKIPRSPCTTRAR